MLVARAILEGEIIPFLGAGANLLTVESDGADPAGRLPNAAELTARLAREIGYPDPNPNDLLRVAQYVGAVLGEGALYKILHRVFQRDAQPNALHELLAGLPAVLRERGSQQQLIMTTNYDDTLERALAARDEDFDVLWYEAKPGDEAWGKFVHLAPRGEPVTIDRPNEYRGLSLKDRPVIVKLHGAVHREAAQRDSYVITENHYIDYMAQSDLGQQIPAMLLEAMADSHFLFLGYSMHDWNLRVILRRIWGHRRLAYRSWAVQMPLADERQNHIEQRLWSERRDIELLQCDLDDYVAALRTELDAVGASDW
jgi:hypothetical protein